ncbi:MAG: transglutaminase [Cereibacter sphaeroides]|uniref:Transglutaminase n=1 Tax=Cereibacter sphaeroides TaxID=1063 RepID=A0A2W5RYE6_CERSP|nr:MAG: transglutaminase [Cereibacter sphaeroides]
MIYDIVLKLSYSYANPAIGGRHLVRMMPADLTGEQRLIAGHLDITPAPAERTDRVDFFGNRASDVAFRGAISRIQMRLKARVDRFAPLPLPGPSDLLSDLPASIAASHSLAPDSPVHFLASSPLVPADNPTLDYARDASAGFATAIDAVTAVGEALHRDFTYDPEATDVDTPLAEAFAARHGVCQDFSHIMIACLRGLGIPAGYVSGLLRTTPPPGRARLEGADAMHAWVRAWCGPNAGWYEYDPTNAIPAGESHIVIARGRDYSDVSPIKGILRLTGKQTGRHAVDVIPLQG